MLTLTGAPLVQRVVDVALHEQAQELVIGLPTRSVGVLPGVVAERLVRALPVGCLHRACTRGMSSMWYVGGAATKGGGGFGGDYGRAAASQVLASLCTASGHTRSTAWTAGVPLRRELHVRTL